MKQKLGLVFTSILLTVTTACQAGGSGEAASKEKPKSKEGKTVVTLSLKTPKPYYEAAVKKFKEQHPDIDLQIQSFKQPGEKWGAGDLEKYVKTTNTALLSGKGADLIEVTDLPVAKNVNKELLLDMNPMLEQDQTLNKSQLQTNVLNALRVNGALYSMPAGFFLRAFVGDGDALKRADAKFDDKSWNWKQFEVTARQLVQKTASGKDRLYALENDPPEVILQEWVVDSYGEFVDRATRKAKFDTPPFADMLRQIKKMYDDKIMTAEPADNGKHLFHSARLFSPADWIEETYGQFSNPKLLQKPHPEGKSGGIRILPSAELAIQAQSAVKEEAWKFVAFLLSEEAQSLPDREGFSLLTSVNEKKLGEIQSQVKSGTYKLASGKAVQVPDEDFVQFKQFLQSADRYEELDIKVLSIVYEESEAFFSGQKSAEEVAKLIQNRTTTYLNE
ncbi:MULTISPECIES: ABC transporter substrate-binding protein [Paenibacillus]|uniref:ABC transporter substrate-binding protein n=1 Tax=Paenibacillus TaxID=44249 RepID=UPI0022B8CACB|nr:extracellular solute-binding protein [Paenibacillus caseinilyticus]MCZ8520333.1 extracellular solute-binding protein [Paenibacillus caseinilyticus]